MNGHIRIRYWDKGFKKYRHGMGSTVDIQGLHVDDSYVAERFTGRRDDYGNDVYEGDILMTKPLTGRGKKSVVTYHNNSARYCGIPFTPLFEVIGNVNENPELLK